MKHEKMVTITSESTEYAVELYDNKGFVRQIEICYEFDTADKQAKKHVKKLNDNEYIRITEITYDEYGNEISFGMAKIYDKKRNMDKVLRNVGTYSSIVIAYVFLELLGVLNDELISGFYRLFSKTIICGLVGATVRIKLYKEYGR